MTQLENFNPQPGPENEIKNLEQELEVLQQELKLSQKHKEELFGKELLSDEDQKLNDELDNQIVILKSQIADLSNKLESLKKE